MEGISTSIPYHQAAREISLAVLEELAPEEVEVALGFLDPLIEMAADDELVYIDSSDISGGFGGSDVLFASVVPAVVATLTRIDLDDCGKPLSSRSEIEETLRHESGRIDAIVSRIGSRRAAENLSELSRVIHNITLRHCTAQADSA